jgi:predicted lipoprotein with Yx(FWY)xxD motif
MIDVRRTVASAIVVLLAATACGGSDKDKTVATSNIQGVGQVLVDGAGRALYSADQEAGGTVRCVSADCVAIWAPLTVPAGQDPTGADGVSGKLSTVSRPDGSRQVVYAGKPLYTFAQDGTGEVKGNGANDAFGGVAFSWHVASVGEVDSGGGNPGY